jgi:uncharacterized membrane protein
MGWLAIGVIAGTFFGVLVGVLVIGLCRTAREPGERGTCWRSLNEVEPNNRAIRLVAERLATLKSD